MQAKSALNDFLKSSLCGALCQYASYDIHGIYIYGKVLNDNLWVYCLSKIKLRNWF